MIEEFNLSNKFEPPKYYDTGSKWDKVNKRVLYIL